MGFFKKHVVLSSIVGGALAIGGAVLMGLKSPALLKTAAQLIGRVGGKLALGTAVATGVTKLVLDHVVPERKAEKDRPSIGTTLGNDLVKNALRVTPLPQRLKDTFQRTEPVAPPDPSMPLTAVPQGAR
jgi:hypothetical protein